MSKKELSKVYEFSNIENKWYQAWEDSDSFKPNDLIWEKDVFTLSEEDEKDFNQNNEDEIILNLNVFFSNFFPF